MFVKPIKYMYIILTCFLLQVYTIIIEKNLSLSTFLSAIRFLTN